MMIADLLSLYRASPMRGSTEALWHSLSPWEWVHVAIVEAFALTFFILTATKCIQIVKFENATERVLREFHDLLFPVPAVDEAARAKLQINGARDE